MKVSIATTVKLSDQLGDAELTFFLHSKGGAEAAANALATNRNALLYNPVAINASAYGLDVSDYTGVDNHGMTVYVGESESLNVLNPILGAQAIDKVILLHKQKEGPFDNHSMKSVLKALEQKEYE